MGSKATHPAYEALRDRLLAQNDALATGSLFGMPCVKAGGKAVLGAFDGGVVFKLDGEAHADALALDGAVLFDPSGKGRPMRAWVVVGAQHEALWDGLAEAAIRSQRG